MRMILEINVGLLGASAIVSSLSTMAPWSKVYNRRMAGAILGFGISGILSSLALYYIVVLALPQDAPFATALTSISLTLFLASTEIVTAVSSLRLWKSGKRKNQK